MRVLGLSADLHDSAAAICVDGAIVAAAEEERFTRRKHESGLPTNAVRFCLETARIEPGDLDAVVFHEKPLGVLDRILATHLTFGPRAWKQLYPTLHRWAGRRLWVNTRIINMLHRLGHPKPEHVAFCEHHLAHAGAAFYPSPHQSAAVVVCDGVGEWAVTSVGHGVENRVRLLEQHEFPHSVGLLYAAATAYCGLQPNSDEYQVMGLAPFGTPRFVDSIMRRVARFDPTSAEFGVDPDALGYLWSPKAQCRQLDKAFGGAPLRQGTPPGPREADIAASVQQIAEEALLALANRAHRLTGASAIVLGGGVALNCVAVGRLAREGPFADVWVQPAAGDAGNALGAALWFSHEVMGAPRVALPTDAMNGAFLGPQFCDEDIDRWLTTANVAFERYDDPSDRDRAIVDHLDAGEVVGMFEGRMEYGPRALGNRSFLADPRRMASKVRLNQVIKERSMFRPFAPAVLGEHGSDWFELTTSDLPYMVQTVQLHERTRVAGPTGGTIAEEATYERSTLPAVTHVDGSARVQTVDRERNPGFHRLLTAWHERTNCPVLINTSFNGAGEPIVCTPDDALRTFDGSGADVLALGGCVVRRHGSHP